ncbi:hypothetical protein ACWC4J_19730 [Streptomyces sp. NPDC001356]|nr:hypothetical protein [Streptomyces argyrophyllae]
MRATLFGRQDSEQAMPLEEFLAKFVRDAAASGTCDEVLALLSGV